MHTAIDAGDHKDVLSGRCEPFPSQPPTGSSLSPTCVCPGTRVLWLLVIRADSIPRASCSLGVCYACACLVNERVKVPPPLIPDIDAPGNSKRSRIALQVALAPPRAGSRCLSPVPRPRRLPPPPQREQRLRDEPAQAQRVIPTPLGGRALFHRAGEAQFMSAHWFV